MDDLLEALELPIEAYPEYPASLIYAFESWPLVLSAYALIAVPAAVLLAHRLSRFPRSYLRTYFQCAIVLVAVLPGAYADGGLVFLPLAGVLAASLFFLWPDLFAYNIGLLVAALGLSAAVALAIQTVASGRRADVV